MEDKKDKEKEKVVELQQQVPQEAVGGGGSTHQNNERVELIYASLLLARGLFIERDGTKGRCVYSSKRIEPGTEVLADEPYVAALKQVC